MATVSIARRYARALLEAADSSARLDLCADQLGALAALLQQNPELTQVFGNPSFSRTQRRGVAEKLLQTLGEMDPIVGGLVRLLVDRDRALLIPDIARLFRDMVDARQGRVRGEVTSAVPLAPDTLQRLERALERTVQRDVVLQSRVDPQLLGGVSARVGSLLFDGSLRSQLEELRATLKRG
jgi:F-type H+-transporting ATPase subunit delta